MMAMKSASISPTIFLTMMFTAISLLFWLVDRRIQSKKRKIKKANAAFLKELRQKENA